MQIVVVVNANVANFSLELFFPFYTELANCQMGSFFFFKICKMFWAGFDSGRLVKVGDAKIAFLFQAKRYLTETSTQPHLRDVRHKQ